MYLRCTCAMKDRQKLLFWEGTFLEMAAWETICGILKPIYVFITESICGVEKMPAIL